MNTLLQTSPAITREAMAELMPGILSWCLNSGIKIIISLVILAISFRVINVVARRIQKKSLQNEKIDKTMAKTLTYLGKTAAKIVIVICNTFVTPDVI